MVSINVLHPGMIFIIGAFLIPILKGNLRRIYLLFIPSFAFLNLLYMQKGIYWTYRFLDYDIVFGRIDTISLCFAYVFLIFAFLGIIYALHLKENGQHIAAFIYIGSSLGVVFSGDLFTLFIFWEIMALSSVFLIWYQKERKSLDAGFRYLLVHAFGGSCLFAGIIIHLVNTNSIIFDYIGLNGLGSFLILIGFLLNAAVPPLHAWLSDAYPEATVTGTVFLSAYTTKTAVYTLLRAFPGTEILIWLGAIMALYGVVFAVLENDIRRLLAYHIISQVGYMVCGVGIGSFMAINGSASHAFCHILYKGLLLMGAGAVLAQTGRSKLTELGGLYRYMPMTFFLYMVGAFSISAFPLFSGFISKSMVIESAAEKHMAIIWLMLTMASVGTFLHTGLKLPYFTFFGKGSSIKTEEPRKNMLLAMGIASFLCIFLGVYPQILYGILPYPVEFNPYTQQHIIDTMQLMLFTALGFFLLLKHVEGEPTITLDTDWFYRKGCKEFMWFINNPLAKFSKSIELFSDKIASSLLWFSRNPVAAVLVMMGRKSRREYPEIPIYLEVISSTGLFFLIFIVVVILVGGVI